MIIADMVKQAAEIGASGFIFASGGPPPSTATPSHYEAFRGFVKWLCGELKPHGITALLEPFDSTVDKCFLYGSTRSCVDLIESLRPDVTNLGIELDAAHLPLMDEPFSEAIHTVAPYLQRVHLGNCVLADPSHPRYGDTHPPLGYPGGEIDIPEIADILRNLHDIGFMNTQDRGDILLEMTPWRDVSVEETVTDGYRRLEEAWQVL